MVRYASTGCSVRGQRWSLAPVTNTQSLAAWLTHMQLLLLSRGTKRLNAIKDRAHPQAHFIQQAHYSLMETNLEQDQSVPAIRAIFHLLLWQLSPSVRDN